MQREPEHLQQQLASCSADLATVNAGTAAQADVLSGKTFSSSSGLGLSGHDGQQRRGEHHAGHAAPGDRRGLPRWRGTVAGDADLVAGNIKNGVDIFGVTGTLSAGGGLPRPAQTTTYGTGSDGDLQKGAARSFTDNGDGTITDNMTGLMWEKKSDDGTIHDKDNTYTWGLTSSPYTMNGTMVTTFLAALNGGGGFAGHTDWRIPNSIRAGEHREPAERESGGGHGLQHELRGELHGDDVQLHAVELLLVVHYLPGQSGRRVVRGLLRRLRGRRQ